VGIIAGVALGGWSGLSFSIGPTGRSDTFSRPSRISGLLLSCSFFRRYR
jgi:hypothetical protein